MSWPGRLFSLLIALAWSGQAWALSTEQLTIVTKNGKRHHFTVEIPEGREEILRGLMFRTHLAPDAGMLFDFGNEGPLVMWMKNTLISLDMIFIGADGKIRAIVQRAVPKSERHIRSPAPGRAVLELNAGTAKRLGIAIGDTVLHRIFQNK